jgi:NitT/TauT family transport system ATP-binding protein
MTLLEVKDLDKAFVNDGRTITAIDQLSLSIAEHEFVSIVGPSGCGKSTFLHIVGGFEAATAGELRLNGRPIGPPGPDRGMMFQDLSLFAWLTAIENVAWPLEMKGCASISISCTLLLRRPLSRSVERRHEKSV